MMLPKIQMVVFDLDMTLCYPLREFPDVFENVFKVPFAQFASTWLKHITIDAPCTGKEAVAACFPRLSGAALDHKVGEFSAEWAKCQKLFDGVEAFLAKLRDATGCKIGIMTNGPALFQRTVINELGLPRMTDFSYASGDREIGRRKPHPTVLKTIERRENSNARESLFVGDSWEKDIEPAMKSGWMTLQVNPTNDALPKIPIEVLLRSLAENKPLEINYGAVV